MPTTVRCLASPLRISPSTGDIGRRGHAARAGDRCKTHRRCGEITRFGGSGSRRNHRAQMTARRDRRRQRDHFSWAKRERAATKCTSSPSRRTSGEPSAVRSPGSVRSKFPGSFGARSRRALEPLTQPSSASPAEELRMATFAPAHPKAAGSMAWPSTSRGGAQVRRLPPSHRRAALRKRLNATPRRGAAA